MKVPKNLLIIGSVSLIEYRPVKNKPGYRAQTKALKNFLIATTDTGTTLYLFAANMTGKKELLKDKSGRQRGHIHTAIEYEIPSDRLQRVGLVESIQYSTEWWEGYEKKYEHIFSEHPALYADKKTRFNVMAIKPKKGKIVTDRGIIG
jgi:hypothetical protein